VFISSLQLSNFARNFYLLTPRYEHQLPCLIGLHYPRFQDSNHPTFTSITTQTEYFPQHFTFYLFYSLHPELPVIHSWSLHLTISSPSSCFFYDFYSSWSCRDQIHQIPIYPVEILSCSRILAYRLEYYRLHAGKLLC
jgi:CRISPR/Cas system endoribonuclease Cas6 (RAMP superfamily)